VLRKLWRLLLTLLLLVPPIAWFLYKPVRVLAPQLLGLVCVKETVCVDDVARAAEAAELYEGALLFVQTNIGEIQKPPRVVFCATDSCFSAFGLVKPAAHTTWAGIIVGPRGWEPHRGTVPDVSPAIPGMVPFRGPQTAVGAGQRAVTFSGRGRPRVDLDSFAGSWTICLLTKTAFQPLWR